MAKKWKWKWKETFEEGWCLEGLDLWKVYLWDRGDLVGGVVMYLRLFVRERM